MQIWPWWKNEPQAAVEITASRSASSSTIEGGVAAEFEVGALEVAAGRLADRPARGGGAGEGDDRHARVGDQGLADVRAARQDLQQVLGQTGLGEDRGERESAADRRARVRLQDDRVAEGEGRGDGADREDQRGVERARSRPPRPTGTRRV